MFRKTRVLPVTCAITCLILVPPTRAFAAERSPTPILDSVRAMATAPAASPQGGSQSVASTTESKMLLGITTGALIVGGIAMVAYGSTSTCKGREGQSTGACDRTAVIGALGFSSGAAMALLWALSR